MVARRVPVLVARQAEGAFEEEGTEGQRRELEFLVREVHFHRVHRAHQGQHRVDLSQPQPSAKPARVRQPVRGEPTRQRRDAFPERQRAERRNLREGVVQVRRPRARQADDDERRAHRQNGRLLAAGERRMDAQAGAQDLSQDRARGEASEGRELLVLGEIGEHEAERLADLVLPDLAQARATARGRQQRVRVERDPSPRGAVGERVHGPQQRREPGRLPVVDPMDDRAGYLRDVAHRAASPGRTAAPRTRSRSCTMPKIVVV